MEVTANGQSIRLLGSDVSWESIDKKDEYMELSDFEQLTRDMIRKAQHIVYVTNHGKFKKIFKSRIAAPGTIYRTDNIKFKKRTWNSLKV